MCGIVGYVGNNEVVKALIKGLEALEYRGYDSAGIAIHTGREILVEKKAGRLSNLKEALRRREIVGRCGIGHTRWATHGAATDENAHPFLSVHRRFAVVHNGIITNYLPLKRELAARGISLRSDTDSEIIAHLIDLCYTGDVLAAIASVVRRLEGSFALAILAASEPNALYGVRKDSPLLVGRGRGECFICSDVSGFSENCTEVAFPNDEVIVRLTEKGAKAYDLDGNSLPLAFARTECRRSMEGSEECCMLSEIHEVPASVEKTLLSYPEEVVARLLREEHDEIAILGCGSAYHAGLTFKATMRELAGVRVTDYVASEFLTERYVGGEHPLFIVVSQSGETADTLRAVKRAKEHGATILAVTNVATSSLVRLADETVLTGCGTERAVAATKSYSAQVAALLRICLQYADIWGKIEKTELARYLAELSALPHKAATVLEGERTLADACRRLANASALYCLGKGADYAAAKEGSLKIKEVSYLFSEAYPSGELKHGTLALMEAGVYALFVATDPRLTEKTASSIAEVACRGASTFAIASEGSAERLGADEVYPIPDTIPAFSPVLSTVAMQLIAYYVGIYRDCDVDRPRNLAKSVTVE